MAYTSDLRIKNLFKDINQDIRQELRKFNIEDRIHLRIFDESSEDNKLFSEGGLAFQDPQTGNNLGSNDVGWLIDGNPLVIVEGTFGTERGQFGDGQLNRFSHSLGVALNGYIGVTYVPFRGESYTKKDSHTSLGIKSKQINVEYATIHNGMLTGALRISESKSINGFYLVMDPYDNGCLSKLVVEAAKKYCQLDNCLETCIEQEIQKMKIALGNNLYASRSKQVLTALTNQDGKLISNWSRFFTQNYEALTTSQKRDGHGLLGKILIDMNFPTIGKFYAIFIRLTQQDLNNLSKRNSKEFKYINNHPSIIVKSVDDLIFKDKELQKEVYEIRKINLLSNSKSDLFKRIQEEANKGNIKLKE